MHTPPIYSSKTGTTKTLGYVFMKDISQFESKANDLDFGSSKSGVKSYREVSLHRTCYHKDSPKEKHMLRFMDLLEVDKLYRKPTLSLEEVSQITKISTRHLSRLINKSVGCSFSELINIYRVEYSKNLLMNANYQHFSVHGIGLEAGFNSKSSFYATFRKHTGSSPAQFRILKTM